MKPILVVDDIPSARRVVVRFLKALGYTDFSEAGSGEEAYRKIKESEFSLVIADLHLKDMDAVDLLQRLKAEPDYKEVPFIVATSDMNKDEFERSIRAGAKEYILKPFSRDALQGKIQKLV